MGQRAPEAESEANTHQQSMSFLHETYVHEKCVYIERMLVANESAGEKGSTRTQTAVVFNRVYMARRLRYVCMCVRIYNVLPLITLKYHVRACIFS